MLRFNGAWRFTPPADGRFRNYSIPRDALEEFFALIKKVATQGDRQAILEHFKEAFCTAMGSTYWPSSSESWAETDLHSSMYGASENAPLFLEAFFDAGDTLSRRQGYHTPDAVTINKICQRQEIGYEIRPPDLVLREAEPSLVPVPERPPTLAEQAITLMEESLRRAEELLAEGRGREAVQETLWLLESVTTAFRGIETTTGTISETYFNQIVRELRKSYKGTTFDRVLDWADALHGYLSSPTGGGVRHGLDMNKGLPIGLNEARLFCNLVRSYLGYLLAEYEYLSRQQR